MASRMDYKKLIYKKDMIPVMQRNMKKYLFFRDWTWYFLVNGTKRFIGQVDMEAQIEEEQGDLSSYQRDLANASEAKSTKENELGVAQKKLADTLEKKQAMAESKRKFENDLGSFKKDIEDMEMNIQKAEQEKTNRDL